MTASILSGNSVCYTRVIPKLVLRPTEWVHGFVLSAPFISLLLYIIVQISKCKVYVDFDHNIIISFGRTVLFTLCYGPGMCKELNQPLISDLETLPCVEKVSYFTIEIGSLRHYHTSAVKSLSIACHLY